MTTPRIEERVEEFSTELMERARTVQGNQYPEDSYEYEAYQTGFEAALAMVYIDLTGTPKSIGMLTKALTETHQAGIDEAIADYQTNYEQKHIAEAVKLVRDEVVEMLKKNYIEPIPEANGSDIDDYMRGYNTALDDTIKALKDK